MKPINVVLGACLLSPAGCRTGTVRVTATPPGECRAVAPMFLPTDARLQEVEGAVAGEESRTDARPEVTTAAKGTGYAALQPLDAYAAEQEGIFAELRETDVAAFRERAAYVLSEAWKAGLLKKEIKDALVARHCCLVLLQVYGNHQAPNFVVRCSQSFPFPSLWVEFTPTFCINDEVVWAPDEPQRAHAMSLNNSTITSRIGGVVKNGDVTQYRVKIREKADDREPWETIVWTNEVVARGLE